MDNFEVALTKSKCPVCDIEFDNQIVLNSKLTKKDAENIKNMHGKVVGFDLCKDCKDKITKNGVYLIGIDPEQSDEQSVYRTGNIIGITKEAFNRIFDKTCDNQWTYCDNNVIKQINGNI